MTQRYKKITETKEGDMSTANTRTCARPSRLHVPRDFAPVSRRAGTRVARLLVRVRHAALRLLRRRAHLLHLNERVHHLETGRPTGVTVRTAALGDGYIDVVLARCHSETLTNDRGRIVVVVAL